MNFLSPLTIAIAAGLTIPPLVMLYFLKLRRQEVPISSTIFWKRAVQDLQVNAPFQRLRRNLLLLLQLLVLLLAAVALGQPLINREEIQKSSLIILIDHSASMNVVEQDGRTRLDSAKAKALKVIDQMHTGLAEGEEAVERAMVIAFSDHARILAPFTDNRARLEDAINSIEPTEGLTHLREAIALANAHAGSELVGRDAPPGSPVSSAPPVRAFLISDGRIADAGEIFLERMDMELISVGMQNDNVGIVALQASRYYERPEYLSVVSGVQNFGPSGVQLDVDLLIAGNHVDVQSIQLGPGIAPANDPNFNIDNSVGVVAFDDVEFAGSGVIEVRLSRQDALKVDNHAYAVIDRPRHVSVLLVSDEKNYWLRRALQNLPVKLSLMSLAQYEQAGEEEIIEGGRARYDVVVFDGCTTSRLPAGNYFFVGQVPAVEGFGLGEEVEIDEVYNHDESHPIMRYVNPSNVEIVRWRRLQLPENALALMDAQGGTVLSLVNHEGNRYLISAFKVEDSTWPLRRHFPVFMYNAIQHLAANLDVRIEASTRPGDPVTLHAEQGTGTLSVNRPDGSEDKISASQLTAHYGRTDLVGIYRAHPTVDGTTSFAVNLCSSTEGRIAPNPQLQVGGEQVEARSTVQTTNVPVWPWILAAALAFLFLEWAVYSKRVLV